MKYLGATAYRFSISWPRSFPNGIGEPNANGLDFYSRLVDELKAAGIEPFATLYHWDLPQTLQDKGGWQSRDIPKAFGDYAGYVAEKLSDRVKHFFTINEFRSFVDMGHQVHEAKVPGGTISLSIAPGLKLALGELNQVRHHAVLGHGMAVRTTRAKGKAGTKVGPAEVLESAVPLIETPEHIKAAETATRERNAPFLTVMLEGKYTDAYLKTAGKDAPKFTDDDLKVIASSLDFVGINVYKPTGGAGQRLLPVEHDGQLRVDLWVRQPLRARARGLQDADADAQAECRVVPRGGAAQRGRVVVAMKQRGPCLAFIVRPGSGGSDGKASHFSGIVGKAGEAAAGTDARSRSCLACGALDDIVQFRSTDPVQTLMPNGENP